jgi:aromatic ring-cleaving dioxygenase
MSVSDAPWHAHIYYSADERAAAEALRNNFVSLTRNGNDSAVLLVGRMMDRPAGPHPLPQYEVHFRARSLAQMRVLIAGSGLRALVHPLTDDDLADHTTLAQWIGAPVDLDLAALDAPGQNQGVARFGKWDF